MNIKLTKVFNDLFGALVVEVDREATIALADKGGLFRRGETADQVLGTFGLGHLVQKKGEFFLGRFAPRVVTALVLNDGNLGKRGWHVLEKESIDVAGNGGGSGRKRTEKKDTLNLAWCRH